MKKCKKFFTSSLISPTSYLRKRFTLIELLVVVAIIAILAGMLLPALNSAREKGRNINCASLQKQIGSAYEFYCNQYDDMIPKPYGNYSPTGGGMGWQNLIYAMFPKGFDWAKYKMVCPSLTPKVHLTKSNYSFTQGNLNMGYSEHNMGNYYYDMPLFTKRSRIKGTSGVTIVGETWNTAYASHQYNITHDWDCPTYMDARHNRSGNFLWLDGHASGVKYEVYNSWYSSSNQYHRAVGRVAEIAIRNSN